MRSTRELADHLGISRWTVSRVLNGHTGVSEETRKRVLETVEAFGFQPSALARGLRGGRTGLVGICFQEMDSPIRARKAAVLQTMLSTHGLRGIMELNAHDPNLELTIIRHFLDLRVDAMVLFGSYLQVEDPLLHTIREHGVPTIVVDPSTDLPLPTVELDRKDALSQGLCHLYDLGHRQIALFGMEHDSVYGPKRMAGLHETAIELGLKPENTFFAFDDPSDPSFDYGSGSVLADAFLKEDCPATAIIALNDCIAIGAIHTLREAGLRIPADISVLGFDDIGVASWFEPPLTTLRQETEILCKATLDLLAKLLQNEGTGMDTVEKRHFQSKLVIRRSTGPAPIRVTPTRG